MVMVDDMAATDLRWMPRIRRVIGARGVTFADGISPNPMCCPARAAFLTGEESHNNGVWSNTQPNGGYAALDGDPRLPEWLQEVGYRTAFFGKHLNGFKAEQAASEPGWDVLDALVRGVYSYRNFTTWNDGDPVDVRRGYVTDHLSDAARRTVRRFSRQDADAPFFLWISHVGPHNARTTRCDPGCWDPPIPAARDRGDLAGVRSPTRKLPSFNRANGEDAPPFLRGLERSSRRSIDTLHQRRVETLRSVDRSVVHLVRTLRRTDELDDTVLVFTSDNGYLLGQYRYVGKRLPYEDAVRVPLLVRGPGVPAGREVTGTATTADLSATVVDLAGARPPAPLDGTSLVPAFADGVTSRESALVQTGASIQGEGDGEVGQEPGLRGWLYRGYRDERWTYVRYPDPAGPDTPAFEELFDRQQDPFELENLASSARHADTLAELRSRARRLEGCSGSSCHPVWGPVPSPTG
ncbi:sulfatase-like hydrolase/transferase [Nocardioides aestuarii]|uniref:Sulfatase-like hydrolase/transferase n=1 Tax=Nocardioides aestuarii TaxID=252231 RepID=A0ABW4TKB4_9ACTN